MIRQHLYKCIPSENPVALVNEEMLRVFIHFPERWKMMIMRPTLFASTPPILSLTYINSVLLFKMNA